MKKVASLTNEAVYHEHVTNYVYSHPEIFNIHWLATPVALNGRSDIRLTVDTEEDFSTVQGIYSSMMDKNPSSSIMDVIDYIDSHSQLLDKMKNQINLNSK